MCAQFLKRATVYYKEKAMEKRAKIMVMLVLLVTAALVCGTKAAVFVSPVDVQTQSNWRTGAALEADREYGTDGYVVYGLNAADGVFTGAYDTALTNPNTAVSLPSYIGDISIAGSTGMWSGNGNFGEIQNPGAGNALTSCPILANGAVPYVATITRASSEPFRLTVFHATGDGNIVVQSVTVDAGSAGSAVGSDPGGPPAPTINYLVYDIGAGSDPIIVTMNSDIPHVLTGFAFDAFTAVPASDPLPANDPYGTGQKVAVDDVFLSWATGVDPDNPEQPNPAIRKHYLYGNFDNVNDQSEPNMVLVAEIDAGTPVEAIASYGPLTLQRDKTYIWRIVEVVDDGKGGVYPPGDPNNITGPVWKFYTVLSIPEITSKFPADQMVHQGEDAVFTVDAINPFNGGKVGLRYQWYKNGEVLGGETAEMLVISGAMESDEAEYLCRVTITDTGAFADSRAAVLVLKRLIGHWPLDGDPNDISGNGYNGTEFGTGGTPIGYAEGVIGEALDCDGTGDYINCGNVPVMESGAMTISFWAKPRNVTLDWKGIVAKWGPTGVTHTFWIGQHSTNGMLNFSIYVPGEVRNTPAGAFQNDEWVHVACSYDGHFQQTYINGLIAERSVDRNAPLPVRDGDLLIGQVPAGGVSPV